MIITNDAKKALGKHLICFYDKISIETRKEGTYLHIIKAIYDKAMADIIVKTTN
jgi:hypothetical protein